MEKPRILVVDDEKWVREFLQDLLNEEGYDTDGAHSGEAAISKIDKETFDLVITDLKMGDVDGIEVLRAAKAKSYDPEVLLVTAYGSVDTAVEAIKMGAFDYLPKPLDSNRALITIEQALERRQLKTQIAELRDQDSLSVTGVGNDFLLYYDSLTGLPNRNLFFDRLQQAMERVKRTDQSLAVILLDIDRFTSINDTYGPEIGDKVLRQVGKRLRASVFDRDTVARMGDDEFGLVVEVKKEDEIIGILERLTESVSDPIIASGYTLKVTTSAGIAVFPCECTDGNSLVRNAGVSLAQAKSRGVNSFQFFTDELNRKAFEFASLHSNLLNALEDDEFNLHYQPYFDVQTGEIAGMEALLRWESPALGSVSPGRFIPVLEHTEAILRVGEWVCNEVCRQIRRWQNRGKSTLPVAINLSPVQFAQDDLSEILTRIIRDHGVDPRMIVFEITETALMRDVEATRRCLTKLKDFGCRVSIDDFGTGYSSLNYLRKFPVDNLKIDLSFIKGIADDPDDAAMVAAIISMAHTLKLNTISEGVETEAQLNILRILRGDQSQGYYHSVPLPPEKLELLLGDQALEELDEVQA